VEFAFVNFLGQQSPLVEGDPNRQFISLIEDTAGSVLELIESLVDLARFALQSDRVLRECGRVIVRPIHSELPAWTSLHLNVHSVVVPVVQVRLIDLDSVETEPAFLVQVPYSDVPVNLEPIELINVCDWLLLRLGWSLGSSGHGRESQETKSEGEPEQEDEECVVVFVGEHLDRVLLDLAVHVLAAVNCDEELEEGNDAEGSKEVKLALYITDHGLAAVEVEAAIEVRLVSNWYFDIRFPNRNDGFLLAGEGARVRVLRGVLVGAAEGLEEILMEVGHRLQALLFEGVFEDLGAKGEEDREDYEISHEDEAEDPIGNEAQLALGLASEKSEEGKHNHCSPSENENSREEFGLTFFYLWHRVITGCNSP